MIIQHKKGDFAGMTIIPFLGYCKSYFTEDGWHDAKTYKVVAAPAKAKSEKSK